MLGITPAEIRAMDPFDYLHAINYALTVFHARTPYRKKTPGKGIRTPDTLQISQPPLDDADFLARVQQNEDRVK